MQELFAKLLAALANGTNSAEVQALLQEIDTRFPNDAWRAHAMVDGVIISEGGEPQASAPPADRSSWLSAKTLLPLLGGLGIGGGAGAGFMSLSWKDLQKLPLPDVTSQWVLLGVVAVLGALVGVGHSFYRNHWEFIMPDVSRAGGRVKIKSFGFLRNMLVASAVSVATTWVAFSNVSADVPDQNPEARANSPKARPTLLTWNVLISAVVAGVVGSRMASGDVEMKTLWTTLGIVAEAPGVPGLREQVASAKNPFQAVTIATKGVAPQPSDTEAELLPLFDRAILKETVAKLGKPLDRNGAGLTLASLELFQHLKSGLKTLLKDFEIAKVADMSLDAFMHEADKRGIEASNFTELLASLHAQSVRVMELLRSLPPEWSIGSERI